jgi:hypothetical protein
MWGFDSLGAVLLTFAVVVAVAAALIGLGIGLMLG